jgi:hypothetical protein
MTQGWVLHVVIEVLGFAVTALKLAGDHSDVAANPLPEQQFSRFGSGR